MNIHGDVIQKEMPPRVDKATMRLGAIDGVLHPLLVILLILLNSNSSSALLPRRPRPLLRLGRHPLPALRVAVLLLPLRPPPEPRLGLPRLEPLHLGAALKQVADDREVDLAGRRRRRLQIQQLVPQVKLARVARQQALEEGAALLAVAVRRAELARGELGQQQDGRVGRAAVAAVARVAQDLQGALEEGARAVRLLRGVVEEVPVVGPDVRGGEAVLLDDLFEEVVGVLLGVGLVTSPEGRRGEGILPCACRTGCRCWPAARGPPGRRCRCMPA